MSGVRIAGLIAGIVATVLLLLVVALGRLHANAETTCNYWPYGYHGSMGTVQCLYGGSLGPEADACPSCLKWPAP